MFKTVNMRIMNWQLVNDKAIRQVTRTMHNGESIVFIICSHRRRISAGFFFCIFTTREETHTGVA